MMLIVGAGMVAGRGGPAIVWRLCGFDLKRRTFDSNVDN